MYPSTAKVLNKLRQKGRKGITFQDFPIGMEIRKRLCELRVAGYLLSWSWVRQSNGGHHKRWVLLKEPKRGCY